MLLGPGQQLLHSWLRQREAFIRQNFNEHHVVFEDGRVHFMSATSSLSESLDSRTDSNLLILSPGAATTLLILFATCLYFQSNTHMWFLNPRYDHTSNLKTTKTLLEGVRHPLGL
jgi:hypothetical protein